jgi:hypothetical protein
MVRFPRLKTNAITQYPCALGAAHRTEVLHFVDGSEQRFPQWAAKKRRWVIRLDLLEEAEANVFRKFFENRSGRYELFTFFDPWTEQEVPNCAFDSDTFQVEVRSHDQAAVSIGIVEVRP